MNNSNACTGDFTFAAIFYVLYSSVIIIVISIMHRCFFADVVNRVSTIVLASGSAYQSLRRAFPHSSRIAGRCRFQAACNACRYSACFRKEHRQCAAFLQVFVGIAKRLQNSHFHLSCPAKGSGGIVLLHSYRTVNAATLAAGSTALKPLFVMVIFFITFGDTLPEAAKVLYASADDDSSLPFTC